MGYDVKVYNCHINDEKKGAIYMDKKIFIYIMNTTKKVNDRLFHEGNVPWPLWWNNKAYYLKKDAARLNFQKPGKGKIFFGPCKKDMRWEISDIIGESPDKAIYIVGLSNYEFQPRRIVYYMKINGKPMTFREAYNRFPNIIGTGIHIKPTNKAFHYRFEYYGKQQSIELKYKHLGVIVSCKNKKAPHHDEWIQDIARNSTNFKKCGPDCCFVGNKDSVFFGQKDIKVDKNFCNLLKKGKLSKGNLDKNSVTTNNPIPNARGNHLILNNESASQMIEVLEEMGDNI